jgi:MinD superfamily P-loop ATPase
LLVLTGHEAIQKRFNITSREDDGLSKHFKTPLGIALNRSDIHPESNRAIKQFAQGNDFPILSEISYDKSMPMAVANAQPVVSAYPSAPASLALRKLAGGLSERINELS